MASNLLNIGLYVFFLFPFPPLSMEVAMTFVFPGLRDILVVWPKKHLPCKIPPLPAFVSLKSRLMVENKMNTFEGNEREMYENISLSWKRLRTHVENSEGMTVRCLLGGNPEEMSADASWGFQRRLNMIYRIKMWYHAVSLNWGIDIKQQHSGGDTRNNSELRGRGMCGFRY